MGEPWPFKNPQPKAAEVQRLGGKEVGDDDRPVGNMTGRCWKLQCKLRRWGEMSLKSLKCVLF